MSKRMFARSAVVLVFSAVFPTVTRAEDKAEQMLQASHDYVAARSLEIQQTVEQTSTVLVNGKPSAAPQTTKQTSTIEIDAGKMLTRMTSKDPSGNDVVVIRKGDRIAMKIGSGPWTVPNGAYAQMRDQLANPFACPLPKPGEERSPKWAIAGREQLDGQEATVIQTVGDTANAYVRERIREAMTSMFPDAATRPTIDVLAYKSRHWIAAVDNRRLRVEQTSHQNMTMAGVAKTVIDVTAKTTAIYSRYGNVQIDVPEEAHRILDAS